MTRLRLFLYGTLRPEAGTRMGRWIERRLLSSEAASVPGRVFAIHDDNGWYPALVAPKCSQSVRGVVCDLVLGPGERALLDHYEGAEYGRRVISARTDGGRVFAVQVYQWRIQLPEYRLAIPSGDFLEWLRDKRLRAFSAPRSRA